MLHYTEILGERYGFRLLTRRELREAVEAAGGDSLSFEDDVCQRCLVETPPKFPGIDACLAGIPTELCRVIMEASGYAGENPSLERDAMAWAMTAQARMDVLICFCFPKVALQDLDDMDPYWYYRYAAASQLVIGGVYGMDASAFLDPSKDALPGPSAPHGAAPPPPRSRQKSKHLIQ